MKRSPFKTKPRKPLKRTKLHKKSKNRIPKLKRELMALAKQIIKNRDGNTCFTCGQTGLIGANWHAGHFIPDAVGGVLLRYHLDNIHSQCYRCNIHLGGWGERYAERMEQKYGRAYVNELRQLKNQIIKADELWYLGKIEELKKLCKIS